MNSIIYYICDTNKRYHIFPIYHHRHEKLVAESHGRASLEAGKK